jgi:diguanylate cyclase (GGDEF)-like protein
VEALALTDGLTGVANRRRFDQYLTIEWRRSLRNPQQLSLLMLDVDLFKLYNDTYGHPRGDNGLKQIAEACMDVVSRPGDLVARFGGEEFVVVLPNTNSEGALQVANEICESLRNRRLPHTGNPFGIVTISIGCATLIPQAGMHAPDLIAMADHALYEAKHNGRNQVCVGSVLEERGEESKTPVLQQAAMGKLA